MKHSQVAVCGSYFATDEMSLNIDSFLSQLIGWCLMVIAMMLPKLIMPVRYIFMRSLKRVRIIFSILFILAYLVIWMVAGVFLIAAIMYMDLLLPQPYIPVLGVVAITLVWQFSPIKQRFLNFGKEHWNLAVFGWPAVRDIVHFGIMQGIWCVGAGWALMLLPMLLSHGHIPAMIIITFIMIGEHLERPGIPKWSLNLRLRLIKAIITQTRIRLIPFFEKKQ